VQLEVDLGKNEVRTKGEEIPLLTSNVNDASCVVVAKEKVRILVRPEFLLKGVLKSSITDFSGPFQRGVLVTASLGDLKNGIICSSTLMRKTSLSQLNNRDVLL